MLSDIPARLSAISLALLVLPASVALAQNTASQGAAQSASVKVKAAADADDSVTGYMLDIV